MRALTACDRGAGHCRQRCRRLLLLLLLRAWEHTAALAGAGQALLPGWCCTHPLLQGRTPTAQSVRMRCAIGECFHAGKGAMGWLALLAGRRLRALHPFALAAQWPASVGHSAEEF